MKIASVQLYMKQHTPPKHKDTDKDLVSWCIDALRNAPRCRIAVQQHGDVSYGTEPVPFLKTMGMIVKRPRNNTTQTLKVHSGEIYSLSDDPTAVLRELRAAVTKIWPQGMPAFYQDMSIAIKDWKALIACFRTAGIKEPNVGPELVQKIMWPRMVSFTRPEDWHDVLVRDLVAVMPDKGRWYDLVPPEMRASTLCRALDGLHPQLYTWVGDQWCNLGIDSSVVLGQLPAVSSFVLDFTAQHGYPPRPMHVINAVCKSALSSEAPGEPKEELVKMADERGVRKEEAEECEQDKPKRVKEFEAAEEEVDDEEEKEEEEREDAKHEDQRESGERAVEDEELVKIADEKEGKEGETEECEQDKPKKANVGEAAEEEVDEKEVEEQEDDEKEGETATGRKRKRTDDKQKKRCRRTKAMMQPPDLDVGWKLRELIPEIADEKRPRACCMWAGRGTRSS